MASGRNDADGGGWACLGVLVAIAAVVAAAISLAALVDPFSWMPSVGEVWSDCEDNFSTDEDECALANRYPGFWGHAIVNLLYALAAGALVVVFAAATFDLRAKRAARFSSTEAAAEHRAALDNFRGAGALLGALALLPIVVAVI